MEAIKIMQSIYVSETQKITKYYVREGDAVKDGDPILSRCAMSFGALNKTALKFAAGHLPSTVVLVLMTAEIARLCVRWLFTLAFMPAVLMLLWSLFTEYAFKKHGAGIAAETEQQNTEDAADTSEKE